MQQLILFLTFLSLGLAFTIEEPSHYNTNASADFDMFSEGNAEIIGDTMNVFDFQDNNNTSTLIYVNPDITQILSVISIQNKYIAISPDGKTLFLYDINLKDFQIYDVSDPMFPTLLNSFTSSLLTNSSNFAALVFSLDGKTGFITYSDWRGFEYLMVIDLSKPASPMEIVTQVLYQNTEVDRIIPRSGSMTISSDGQTVFVWTCVTTTTADERMSSILAIIDVSTITNPKEISHFSYSGERCASQSATSIFLQRNKLFYNNGFSLLVLNVSDLTDPTLDSTVNLDKNVSVGLAVSPDGKNAFIVNEDYTKFANDYDGVTSLQIVNIANPAASINISLGFFPPPSLSQIIALSPNNDFLFVSGGSDVMFINITDITNVTYGAVSTISNPNLITLSPDGRIAFVANDFEVAIVKLYIDVQINQVFSLPADTNMQLILFPTNGSSDVVEAMAMSSDNNIVFLVFTSGVAKLFDISDLTSPKFLGMLSTLGYNDCNSIIISPDDQTAFVTCDFELLVVNISNPTSPNILNTYSPSEGGAIAHFEISPDGQVGFLAQQNTLTTINISRPESPVQIETLKISPGLVAVSFGLSKDASLGFLLLKKTTFYDYSLLSLDTSNASSLTEINFLSLDNSVDLLNNQTTNKGDYTDTYVSISPNNEAVLVTLDINGVDLHIFNFSNFTSPTRIFWPVNISPVLPVVFSQDSTTAFICTSTEFLVVNISPLTESKILRSYPALNVTSITLSQDESMAHLGLQNSTG